MSSSENQIERQITQFQIGLQYYRESVPEHTGQPWVLFVVEDVERNVVD
jgi:hypothetical protein